MLERENGYNKEVRGFQQFFRRSKLADTELLKQYQSIMSESIGKKMVFFV